MEQTDGERRHQKRYCLRMPLEYHARCGDVLLVGEGQTIDLSSSGIGFQAGESLPEGAVLELEIEWPLLSARGKPLKLTIWGRIVRSTGTRNAMRAVRYSFRERDDADATMHQAGA